MRKAWGCPKGDVGSWGFVAAHRLPVDESCGWGRYGFCGVSAEMSAPSMTIAALIVGRLVDPSLNQ